MNKLAWIALLGLAAAASPATAQKVTGSLVFHGNSANYFDPAQNFVPTGAGNKAGTTVAIGPGVEFGYDDGDNRDTADFTGSTLTINDVSSGFGAYDFVMTFTADVAGFFNNAAFTTNGFGGSLSVTGNTLTFTSPTTITGSANRTAVITFAGATAAVPEPAGWGLMIVGLASAGAALRRRRGAGSADPSIA